MRSIKDDLTLRRLDGARTDSPRCIKGKPCGDRCIPRTSECQRGGGVTPLGAVDRQVERLNKRLSNTEKLALAGLGVAALTSSAAIPVYRRITRPLSQTTQNLTRENAEQLARVINENAEQTGAEFVKGAVREVGTTVTSATNAGWERHRKAQTRLINTTRTKAVQTAGSLRDIVQQARTRSKPIMKTLERYEPESVRDLKRRWAIRDLKRRWGIKTDSATPRLDKRPKCGPGNKPCGSVCIPQRKKCNEGRGTSVAQKFVGGVRKFASSEAAGAAVGIGLLGAATYLSHRAVKTNLTATATRKATQARSRYTSANPTDDPWVNEWLRNHKRTSQSTGADDYWRQAQEFRNSYGEYARKQRQQQEQAYREAVKQAGKAKAQERVRSVLGIDPNAPKNEVRSRFKKWAMKHHPDRGGDTATFQEISAIITDYYKDSKDRSIWAEGFSV